MTVIDFQGVVSDVFPQFSETDVILQVIPELDIGGAERSCVDIAIALKQAGAKPMIWSHGGSMVLELATYSIAHYKRSVHSKNPLKIIKNALSLAKFIHQKRVKLLHARSRAPAWSALIAAKLTGIPFVTTFHATYNFSSQLKKFYNSVMVRSDAIIANSGFIKNHILKNYHPDFDLVTVIPRGVSEHFLKEAPEASRIEQLKQAWGMSAGEKIILVPARLTRWKGQESVIRALSLLQVEHYKCVFLGSHQGREEYYASLVHLALALGVKDKIHFAHHCKDMVAAYHAADVVISSSIEDEAFGRVIVEAQACGKPVIVTKVGAYEETSIVHETGFWVEPNHPQQMAEMMNYVLGFSTEKQDMIAQKARDFVKKNYLKQKMCARTLGVYKRLMDAQN